MENASKALIIAGAILISILIIGLGVAIYQNAAGNVTGAKLDKETIMAQNDQFERYFGNKVSGSDVKALFALRRTNNSVANRDGEAEKVVEIVGITEADVKTSKYYKIEVKDEKNDYWPNGFIKTISISETK